MNQDKSVGFKNTMKKPCLLVPLLGLLMHPTMAHAQDLAVISTAREFAKEALQAYDEGRYEEAAEKSRKAYQVVRVPTLAVNRARALVKLGKLVAASELYLEAKRLPRDPSWQAAQDEAIANAERERAELLPRIPRVKLSFVGADASQVAVRIDDRNIPAALLDANQLVDPGERVVVGTVGQQTAREVITAKEGEAQTVTLRFVAAPTVGPVAVTPAPPPTVAASTLPDMSQTPTEEPRKSTRIRPLLGWIGVGLGGASVLFGTIEGFSAKSKRNLLIATGQCSSDGTKCEDALSDRVDSYRTARTLSMVGLYAGGALAAVGVTLLVIPSKKESQPTVGLVMGPSFIGVRGEIL